MAGARVSVSMQRWARGRRSDEGLTRQMS
jgi:hypothetical protein